MIVGIVLAIPFCCGFAAICGRDAQRISRRAADEISALVGLPVPPFQTKQGPGPDRKRHSLAESSQGDGRRGNRVTSRYRGRFSRKHGADVEILRIEEDLERIRRDPSARQGFYDEMTRLVENVRNNQAISQVSAKDINSSASVISSSPHAASTPSPPGHASLTPLLEDWLGFLTLPLPRQIVAHFGGDARGLHDPPGSGVDAQTASRLLYWARKNGCPPQLALATAWQESRISLRPPDGSSGEIGIMQILPARARSEGVDPRSLRDPDVDMWLGTKLLARYYREEGSIARAAMKYVAGPGVFDHRYPAPLRDYIRWYSMSVQDYADYFAHYVKF
jgi:hypothetical protein